ncbi:MAG: clostripain-related cysteine peptidase [Pseudobacter sp.]|uniref:clostripain-related cysteine peptidase n=1 Tax=Pseudobacter sp. TaxID=2045420 RepID=UPI003F808EE5
MYLLNISQKHGLIAVCLCVSSLFQNCRKAKNDDFVGRTVLVYMAANNDLSEDAVNSFNAIKAGAKNFKGELLVLLKTGSGNSYLIRVNQSAQRADTIRIYRGQNTSDPDFLSSVINESRLYAPSASFGLVFWSHATSWAPPGGVAPNAVGADGGREMDIRDFRNALRDNMDFILFDACSMASIEAIYEMKGKAKYILASPSEVLASSYPYETVVPLLFGGPDELMRVCEKFVQYYDTLSGINASATVSLIDTRELDKLAALTKQLLSQKLPVSGYQRSSIQKLNFDITSRVDAYDFLDFFDKNYSKEEYKEIKQQLDKAIIYKDHTASFLGSPIRTFSGLSIYLPDAGDPLRSYYGKFSWAKESNWSQLFPD